MQNYNNPSIETIASSQLSNLCERCCGSTENHIFLQELNNTLELMNLHLTVGDGL